MSRNESRFFADWDRITPKDDIVFSEAFRTLWFQKVDRGLLITRKIPVLSEGFRVVRLKSSLRKFYGHHHHLVDRYGVSVSQICSVCYNHNPVLSSFETRIIITRRMPPVEQELLTIPELLNSTRFLVGVRVLDLMFFGAIFCRSLFVLFFLLVIVLSVLLRFTPSDYPFGIFNLFIQKKTCSFICKR
jgi:hypothetical protein